MLSQDIDQCCVGTVRDVIENYKLGMSAKLAQYPVDFIGTFGELIVIFRPHFCLVYFNRAWQLQEWQDFGSNVEAGCSPNNFEVEVDGTLNTAQSASLSRCAPVYPQVKHSVKHTHVQVAHGTSHCYALNCHALGTDPSHIMPTVSTVP